MPPAQSVKKAANRKMQGFEVLKLLLFGTFLYRVITVI